VTDFIFSLLSSGFWHRVVMCYDTKVSEDYSLPLFRGGSMVLRNVGILPHHDTVAQLEDGGSTFSETLVFYNITTRCHYIEDRYLNLHRLENLKISHFLIFITHTVKHKTHCIGCLTKHHDMKTYK